MSIAALMEAMSAAGAPLEAVIIAVRAIEAKDAEIAARDDAAAARRAKDAARKRDDRASADNPRTMHGQSTDAARTEPKSPPALDKEKCPKEINPTPRVSANRATRITLDWNPTKPLPDEVAALVALWPPGRVERELGGFRDYWVSRSKDAARTDWDRTWWNRIRDQHDRVLRDSRNGHRTDALGGNRGRTDGPGRTVAAALDFIADGQHH